MGVYNKIGFEPYNSIISDANHEKQATTNAADLICSPVLAWDIIVSALWSFLRRPHQRDDQFPGRKSATTLLVKTVLKRLLYICLYY